MRIELWIEGAILMYTVLCAWYCKRTNRQTRVMLDAATAQFTEAWTALQQRDAIFASLVESEANTDTDTIAAGDTARVSVELNTEEWRVVMSAMIDYQRNPNVNQDAATRILKTIRVCNIERPPNLDFRNQQ